MPPGPFQEDKVHSAVLAGRLDEALDLAKADVRRDIGNPEPRISLFQVLSLLGQWEAASKQLVAASKLVSGPHPWSILLNSLIRAEIQRSLVFAASLPPTVFGSPPAWAAHLVGALKLGAEGRSEEAFGLQQTALDEAPERSGLLNGQPFAWLSDGDTRLGPLFEMVLDGTYFWVPQSALRSIAWKPPSLARDLVWAPGEVELTTGATIHAFFPVRYPGAEGWRDDRLRLARLTDWHIPVEGAAEGKGQRLFFTDQGEYPMLEIVRLEFTPE